MDAIATGHLTVHGRYEALKAQGLNLDLTRGKPSDEQLNLSLPMLEIKDTVSPSGQNVLNYGPLEGLPEARELCSHYLGTPWQNTWALGNSSLAIMHDIVVQMLVRQFPGSARRWDPHHNLRNRPAMLCPVPGYDRHHAICVRYGITMVPIPMTPEGPDLDAIKAQMQGDNRWNIFGIWCVPKYANPSGVTYSRRVCEELAQMDAPDDFRIFWDNAYAVHDLEEETDALPNMLELCAAAKHPDRAFVIGSTSKITFASAGMAMLAASGRNLAWLKQGMEVQTIGPDRLTQLRHVLFLQNMDGVRQHMAKHRLILRPKFDAVEEVLERELGGRGLATWNRPKGGYFVSMYVPGHAREVVRLAAEAGVKLTPAGAAYPYSKDPDDSHIRLAPTFPPLAEVRQAMEVVAMSVRVACGK